MTSDHGHADKLQSLVIQADPTARTTHEVAHQLSELLPIESLDNFVRDARVSVAGEELSVEALGSWLSPELFPVRDQADLVMKVAAAVRVAGHIMRRELPPNVSDAHLRLARELAGEASGAGVGVFRGPSVFKVEAEMEDER